MAGTCEACRSVITVTQKRIKCTHCLHLYHSECINFTKESASRSQWVCPACVAAQRAGGDNSNTPVRCSTKPTKELSLNLLKGGTTSLPTSPMASQELASVPSTATSRTELSSNSDSFQNANDSGLVSQIEKILDFKLNLLKNEMIDKLQTTLVTEFRKELNTVTTKYNQLEVSHTKLLSEHETLRKDFTMLKKKTLEDGDKLLDLHVQLNKQQQWARMANIEVVGLPETQNESTIELVVKIAKHAGVELHPAQIESAHRVQPMQKVEGRPKPIVVKLQTRLLKDQIISGLRKSKGISTRDLGLSGAERRFFVNEHLTPHNKQLLKAVKSRANDKSYKFVWVRNCNIFLRRNEESPIVTIGSEKDLLKIV